MINLYFCACLKAIVFIVINFKGALAQLARALDWQSKGQGFDSPMLHQRVSEMVPFFIYSTFDGTTKTGIVAFFISPLLTLPISKCIIERLPCEPVMIISALSFSASSKIVCIVGP